MSSNPFKDILDQEEKNVTNGVNKMSNKLTDFAKGNKNLNDYKKQLYTHLISLNYDGSKALKSRINSKQFYVLKEGLKINIPLQIKSFRKLQQSTSNVSKDIQAQYLKYSYLNKFVPLKNFSEHAQKINFNLLKDVESLINILEIQLKAISRIEDISSLNETFRKPGSEHTHNKGLFQSLSFNFKSYDEKQKYYAKDFIAFFEQERELYKRISNYLADIKNSQAQLSEGLKNVTYASVAEAEDATVAVFRFTKGMTVIAFFLAITVVLTVSEISPSAALTMGGTMLASLPAGLIYALINTERTYKTSDRDVSVIAQSLAKRLKTEVEEALEKVAVSTQGIDMNISTQGILRVA